MPTDLIARGLRIASIVAGLMLAAAAAMADVVPLAPHRAIYDVTLAAARGGAGVSAISGRIAYELTGSACEGYTQTMRFVTRMTNQSGSTTVSDLRSSTWEEGSGKRFRFDSSQFRDERRSDATAGDAARPGPADDVKVDLTKPEKKSISLPARIYFPIEHTVALIDAGRVGKTSLRANLFDGSEKGEKVYDTVSVIGKNQPPASRKLAQVKNAERLTAVRAWPVSIAYFERTADGKDALPVYELSFLMFENGVSRRLHIDYGEFALRGELREIVFHAPSKCEKK
jgi:hypothetical protein